MAAMKSMIQILLDVSPSMQTDHKLEMSKAFIGHYIMQRIIASKTVEFGLMTYGDDTTHNYLNSTQGGYEHVNEIIGMGKPNDQTLCAIPKVHPGRRAGDLLDGLIAAQDVLIRVNGGKAYNRILLLITDGESKVEGKQAALFEKCLGLDT
ncbi:VWA domain-containing protein [archaeon]|nr:MAG: VWA domain-containing protein [archaeon]